MSSVSAESAVPTPLQRLHDSMLEAAGVEVFVKREDLRDPWLGGNKWCKLQGHLQAARALGADRLLSVGGVWSNHLHALAVAGARNGFRTVGLVRGNHESAMLDDCRRLGMTLVPLGYAEYRRRDDADLQATWQRQYGPAYFIPEGGGGQAGLGGFQTLAAEIRARAGDQVVVAVAVGTGTTLAGLAAHLPEAEVWGFPVLPLADAGQRLAALLPAAALSRCRVWHGLVDTGYGRLTGSQREFMTGFEQQQEMLLDPVYTVKLFQALFGLARQGKIPHGTRIVALHSGGLQGRRGFGLPYAVDDVALAALAA